MKICLMPGHSPKDGGSVIKGGPSEHAFALSYIEDVAEVLRGEGHEVVITERIKAGGTSPSYSATAANATGADLAVEFHFNAAGETANGAEWLFFGPSAASEKVAAAMLAEWCKRANVRNRGTLPCFENEAKAAANGRLNRYTTRGYNAFSRSRMRFFMAEPFFCSNTEEAKRMQALAKNGKFAEHMAAAILAGVKLM